MTQALGIRQYQARGFFTSLATAQDSGLADSIGVGARRESGAYSGIFEYSTVRL
ncbi:hypothetical protein IU487_08440 [Nocardia puris]|uniref:hypothetical protein n=1 Tax=Nocardia puris TaxID=208602 RepID=UPI0014734298|nr:hypothetical protein [Nocardia puris]MBF6211076.1 hypothetical protein [Nocardia puris]